MRVLLVGVLLTALPFGARGEERPWDLGVQLAGDLPAGAVAALTFRPFAPWARLHGGVTWNYYAFGVQAGLTVAPLRSRVTPTATIQGGMSFDADLRSPLSGFQLPAAVQPSLTSAGYTYATGLLGLEVGEAAGTVLFLRAGLTRAWSTVRGIDRFPSGTSTISSSPIHLAAWAPAATVGLALRIW